MFPLVASRPAIDRRMRAQWDICTSRYRTYNPVSCPSMLNITSKIERSVFLENITAMTHDIKQHYIHFTVPTSNVSEGHSSNIRLVLPMRQRPLCGMPSINIDIHPVVLDHYCDFAYLRAGSIQR